MRNAIACILLVLGAGIILVRGPEYGVNGASVLGVLVAFAGLVVFAFADDRHTR